MPQQEGINVAEDDVACLRQFPRTLHMFENPANFQSAEISGQRQPGLPAKAVLPSASCHLTYVVRHTCVLPHECVRDRFARLAVPYDGGLALVCDSDRGQVLWLKAAFRHRLRDHLARVLPDIFRVVLNPSWLGINLFVFLLGNRFDSS